MRHHRLAALALSTCFGLPLFACVHHVASPSSFAPNEPHDAVVVSGEGEVHAAPDIVRLQLGVEARATDAKTAIDAANAKMTAIIHALKQLGVDTKDLQTSDFSIHSEVFDPRFVEDESMTEPMLESAELEMANPRLTDEKPDTRTSTPKAGVSQRVGPPAPVPPRPAPNRRRIVYRVSNMLHVTLRDLSRLGDVLSQSVAAGANQAHGVSFDIEKPAPLVDQARAKAVADAKRKATELARVAGVKLGRVVSISEQGGGGGPMPAAMAMASREFAYEAKAVPTESGQLTLRQHVRVVFAIDDNPKQ